MRVLLVTPKISDGDGGGEVSVRLLARELARGGKDVRVLAAEAAADAPGLTVAPLTPGNVAESARDADVVHAYNLDGFPAARAGARRAGKPVVVTANSHWADCLFADRCFPDGEVCTGCTVQGLRRCFRDRNPLTIGRRVPAPVARAVVWRRTRALADADRIVVQSKASGRLLTQAGIPAGRVRVVPNVVDAGILPEAPVAAPARENLVLFVGALKHAKGPHVLVDAVPRLGERVPDARVLVAGDGPERAALEARARRLGVAHRVTFAGRVPYAELADLYARAGVFALPVLWEEPFPRVLLESWGHGVPVVTSDRGGPGEYVEDGITGRIVPAGDPAALADALADVLTDRARAAALAEAGLKGLSAYHPDRIIPRLVGVYREVV